MNWWKAYPDEFALDNFDDYQEFPESKQSIGSVRVMFPRYAGYENGIPPFGKMQGHGMPLGKLGR